MWLVEVNNQLLSVYRQIKDKRYQIIENFVSGQNLSILQFPESMIRVAEIFGG